MRDYYEILGVPGRRRTRICTAPTETGRAGSRAPEQRAKERYVAPTLPRECRTRAREIGTSALLRALTLQPLKVCSKMPDFILERLRLVA